jgi:translation initiation factor 2B subunit (eIF-2B alpha/beta/delta family)
MSYVLPEEAAARLAELAADRVAGAREIAGRLLHFIPPLLAEDVDPADVLVAVVAAVLPRQPSMAALLAGADRLFRAAARDGARAVEAEVARQLGDYDRDLVRIAEAAEDVVRPLRSVAILSWSSTVAAVLERAPADLVVYVAESRPGAEGRRAAQRAANAGRRTIFLADAAFPAAAAEADALLLGGDALTKRGLLNKVGSRAAAREVAAAGRPVYACLEDLKIVGGPLVDRLRVLDEPGSQLWESPPAGVVVRNRYFESVPLALLTAVVTAVGVESPGDALERVGPEEPGPAWSRIPAPVAGVSPW